MATTIEPEVKRSRQDQGISPDAAVEAPAPGGRRRLVLMIVGAVLLVLVAGGVRKYIWSRSHVSTDNAQVDGHIVPILPKVGGFVLEVRVDENQDVKAGDALVILDDRDYRARLQQAEADLGVALANVSSPRRVGQADAAVRQAQANAHKAHQDLERLRQLASPDSASQQQLDGPAATLQSAHPPLAAPPAPV